MPLESESAESRASFENAEALVTTTVYVSMVTASCAVTTTLMVLLPTTRPLTVVAVPVGTAVPLTLIAAPAADAARNG